MQNDPIVIVGAARTPMGGFQGDFSSLSASDLGAVAIKAAVERAGIATGDVQEVLFGNCLKYRIIHPGGKWHDCSLIAREWTVGKGVNVIILQFSHANVHGAR